MPPRGPQRHLDEPPQAPPGDPPEEAQRRQGAKMTALTPQPFETSEKNTKSAREQSPILLALKIVVSLRSRLILFFVTPQTAREQALFFSSEKYSGFA